MDFTKVDPNAYKELQLNAGILLDEFTPTTKEIGNILGATSGGVSFTDTPVYQDYGSDIDNAPTNVKQLKQFQSREVKLSGTYVTIDPDSAASLIGAATTSDVTAASGGTSLGKKIIPRSELETTDFSDIWWVGDKSDGGCIAIHIYDALSTGGFKIQTTKNGKGKMSFEYTAHYDIDDLTREPYEIYILN